MPIEYHVNQVVMQLPLFTLSKICNTCGIEKVLDAFEQHSYGYRRQCKECRAAKKKRDRAENPEHFADIQRACYRRNREENCRRARERKQRPEVIQHRRQYYRNRYTNDAEYRARQRDYQSRYVSEHPEMARTAVHNWFDAHPYKRAEYTMSYNARKKNAPVVEDVDYLEVLTRDGFWCHICETAIDPDAKGRASLAFDHVIPLTRKGTHTSDNIKPAHKCCNSRKHNKFVEEMTPYQRRGPLA